MEKIEFENIYRLEKTYWWYKVLDSLVEDSVIKYFQDRNIIILDAGCGTGRMIEKLSSYGEIEGIDASSEAIDYCKLRGLKNIELADLNTWEAAKKRYNLIISLDVLYHKTIKDVKHVVISFFNALKPEGILLLNLPAFRILERDHDLVVGGDRRFKRKDFLKMISDLGFKTELASYRLPLLFLFILIQKYLLRQKKKISSDLKEINPAMNKILYKFHLVENKIIKSGIRIPFGSSLFVVAVKPALNQIKKEKTYNTDSDCAKGEKTDGRLRSNILGQLNNILNKIIIKQLAKYSIVGIINTLIGLGTIFILYNILNVNYIASNMGGYLVGMVNSFIWNKQWTFASKNNISKEMVPFIIVLLVSYVVNLIVVIISVEFFNIDHNIAQLLGIGSYSSTNFILNRHWTFSFSNKNNACKRSRLPLPAKELK